MIKLMVGCAPFEGKVHIGTAASLSDERLAAFGEGVALSGFFLPGAHYVAEAYNSILKHFLDSDFEKLAFVEHDVSWVENPGMAGALAKLAKLPHDYVGGSTRYKSEPEDYMIGFIDDDRDLIEDEHGCLEVAWIPQGFSVASRAMVQAMWDNAVDKEYIAHGKTLRQVFHEDFRPGLGKLGQDLGFCRDWRAMGGKVHVKPDLTLTHTACVNHAYKGNLAAWLRGQMTPAAKADEAAFRETRGAA